MLELAAPFRAAEPPPAENQYHSCNFEGMLGWADPARRHFLHAIMAANAYDAGKERKFYHIAGWEVRRYDSSSDLQLDAYARPSWESPLEIVVAFAGTDGCRDWVNNFSFVEPPQYREGISFVKDLKDKHPQAKIWVVGHSLGGGIALNAASRIEGVEAVAFNSSPRSTFGADDVSNSKTAFYEVGEALQIVRFNRLQLFLKHPEIKQWPYNFLSFKPWRSVKVVAEHSMYLFSRGLLLTAVRTGDPVARQIFTENVVRHAPKGTPGADIPEWCKCHLLYSNAPLPLPRETAMGEHPKRATGPL